MGFLQIVSLVFRSAKRRGMKALLPLNSQRLLDDSAAHPCRVERPSWLPGAGVFDPAVVGCE